jgi:hypothetical protein
VEGYFRTAIKQQARSASANVNNVVINEEVQQADESNDFAGQKFSFP